MPDLLSRSLCCAERALPSSMNLMVSLPGSTLAKRFHLFFDVTRFTALRVFYKLKHYTPNRIFARIADAPEDIL
eukprot:728955-Pleurochrysis_carterae.AAC.2